MDITIGVIFVHDGRRISRGPKEHRSPEATHWHVLTTLNASELTHGL